MRKTKAKRGIPLSGRRWPFVALSVLIFILGGVIEAAFVGTRPTAYLSFDQLQIAIFGLRLIPVLLQVILIERFLKQSMRGWLVNTTLGTLITLLVLTQASVYPSQLEMVILVGFLTITLPKTILQTIWLRGRFKQAWLWLLFILLSAYIVPEALRVMAVPGPILASQRMLFAVIEALLIFHLLSRPQDTEKAKVDFATDQQADEATRIERLQENETHNPLWDTGAEQALQSEA